MKFKKDVSVSSGNASVNSEFKPQICKGSNAILNRKNEQRSFHKLNHEAKVRQEKQENALIIQYKQIKANQLKLKTTLKSEKLMAQKFKQDFECVANDLGIANGTMSQDLFVTVMKELHFFE